MKETKVFIWCDIHGEEREEATITRTISLDGAPRYTLDLCEKHDKELINPVSEALETYGAIAGPTAGDSAPTGAGRFGAGSRGGSGRTQTVVCEICHREVQRYSVVDHYWRHSESGKRPPTPTTCPECGVHFAANAMSMHRASAHGYDSLALALAAARAGQRALIR